MRMTTAARVGRKLGIVFAPSIAGHRVAGRNPNQAHLPWWGELDSCERAQGSHRLGPRFGSPRTSSAEEAPA